jgi:hypothetical protein
VTGIVKPGADIATLSNSVKDPVITVGKNDVIIFGGGMDDVSKNYSKIC